jgi:hypothetical protein
MNLPPDFWKIVYPDPYDLWSTRYGVKARELFYRGRMAGKLSALAIGLADWLGPALTRRLSGAQPRMHPTTLAHLVQWQHVAGRSLSTQECRDCVSRFQELAAVAGEGGMWAWGLGFDWMSKNGLYDRRTPFVTHTPYVMEALLALQTDPRAVSMFEGTWAFLQALKPMVDSADHLALSYAPVVEPRIVVNANTYACFAFALHARYGSPAVREHAEAQALRLARWVVSRQQQDGAWWYYADDSPGNFIDGFHSCFVLKNLHKSAEILPSLRAVVAHAIHVGRRYLHDQFLDQEAGLCRRFLKRDIKDPFAWDIYDQAEYLGVLLDEGRIDEATRIDQKVMATFTRDGQWWCRIDVLGRRWGRNFLRWGITPYLLQQSRLGAQTRASLPDQPLVA